MNMLHPSLEQKDASVAKLQPQIIQVSQNPFTEKQSSYVTRTPQKSQIHTSPIAQRTPPRTTIKPSSSRNFVQQMLGTQDITSFDLSTKVDKMLPSTHEKSQISLNNMIGKSLLDAMFFRQ
jgi:hypothetical protein